MKVSHLARRLIIGTDRKCAEDELQNVEMAEEERRKKNQDLKIKKRDYTGYDDDEFAPGNEGMKRAVLAKYDEDIDGIKEIVRNSVIYSRHALSESYVQDFRLGASVVAKQSAPAVKEKGTASVNKSLLSIDYASTSPSFAHSIVTHCSLENMETNDYLKEGDIGFKKPKVSAALHVRDAEV